MNTQTTVPLHTLGIDPMNVRSIGRGEGDPELKASLKAYGVKLPLIVRPGGPGHTAYVGGRRLEQLQALAKEGAIAADYPVPVIIEDVDDARARQVSLTENVIRRAMHPVDEYRAFASLHTDPEKPLDIETIADRFGLGRRHVEQRLALGKLHPKVLDAWRQGHISQDTAQAFTLCGDTKQQGRLFDLLRKRGSCSAWAVKQELKIGHDNVGRLIDVVGKDAYEARGGKVHVDLFGTDHQVSDPALVREMLQEQLDAKVCELEADGWSFVLPGRPDDWHLYGQLEPKLKPTDKEKADLVKLRATGEDENLGWDGQREAEQALEALLDAIALRSYGPQQKAKSGCFVSMDGEGSLSIDHGKVKPSTSKDAKAEPSKAGGQAKPKGDAEPSRALRDRLASQLAQATKDALLADKHPTALAALSAKVVASMITPDRPGSMPSAVGNALGKIREAITSKVLNEALRKRFDAADYFKSVPKALCVKAASEAVNEREAGQVAGMAKAEMAKWCVTNVAKKGWLPVELRGAAYDGPGAKAVKK